ncbi:MAG: hypothetical protein ACJ71Q_15975 [Terriglobales bacterium]
MPKESTGIGRREDRDLQDSIIRHLTDANARAQGIAVEYLDGPEAERAERFSRFLARRYYRDRLSRGFRYSAKLVDRQNAADHLPDSAQFESILDDCVLSSIATSRAVGELAVTHLVPFWHEEWWSELLEYERAFFLQLATSEATPSSKFPQRSTSTIVRTFEFDLPELLVRLKSEQIPTQASRRAVTLLFSRTHVGRVYVVELDTLSAAVLDAIDGKTTLERIPSLRRMSATETQRVFTTLAEVGAIVVPTA